MATPLNSVFTDFDYDIAPLIAQLPAGWTDVSWRNDACPSLGHDTLEEVRIWCDYADATKSEYPDARAEGLMHKFAVSHDDGRLFLSTDDFAEVVAFCQRIAAEGLPMGEGVL